MIITIAGSGENGYDGDDEPATEAALNNPSAVAAAPNGDIYIADTLNYRVRMIDHATGLIHTIAGDGEAGDDDINVGDGGQATSAHLNMPSDVALGAERRHLHRRHAPSARPQGGCADARIISTVAGSGRWGNTGDDGPATAATLAGPAGVAVVADATGRLTLFIADYYNGRVRVGRTRRDHPSSGRRERGVRCADARRVRRRSQRRVALRDGLEQGPRRGTERRDRRADAPAARSSPAPAPARTCAAASAGSIGAEDNRMSAAQPPVDQRPLLPWTLSFMRPYRGRVAGVAVLMLLQVGLGALEPWPLKIVIDYVLGQHDLPEILRPWAVGMSGGSTLGLLVLFVLSGVVLQLIHQVASAVGVRLQTDTGQRMVYDLRYRLLEHLQSLGLNHHITTNTGDAVYRVDVDSYSIENLAISGVFPLASSVITLVVMFAVLARLDMPVALLSLTVVPFLFLSLRYYANSLSQQEEHVKELESSLISRLYEIFSSIRLVKSFAREPLESNRYATAGRATMQARIAVTWKQGLFGLMVATTTILGTRARADCRRHARDEREDDRRQPHRGDQLPRRRLRSAVVDRLHHGTTPGGDRRARRVRAMLALEPETNDAPDAIDATSVKGNIVFDHVSFSYPDGTQVLHDIAFEAQPGQMVAVVGLTGAGKTTLVSLIPRFYNPTSGQVLIDGDVVQDLRAVRYREPRGRRRCCP